MVSNIEIPEGKIWTAAEIKKIVEEAFIRGQEDADYHMELEKKAYEQGYAEGQDAGYDNGYAQGYAEGREVGYDNGYEEGYDNGCVDGYEDGYTAGYADRDERARK